jgi:hypothetical protein
MEDKKNHKASLSDTLELLSISIMTNFEFKKSIILL